MTDEPGDAASSAAPLNAGAPCAELLQGVSRTFALSIPELPHPLDEWVGSAYLLCRMVDTIEDRPDTDEPIRQRMFDDLAAALGPPVQVERCRPLVARFADRDDGDPCNRLMKCCHRVLAGLARFPNRVVDAIRNCAVEMIDGLRRTPPPAGGKPPRFLYETLDELEQYCHYAAGVVGMMLTRLFHLYLGRHPANLDEETLGRGRRFGLGLQLTNIVKDHPSDLADGRSFIPPEAARRCGLDPGQVLQPELPPPVRALVASRAADHLDCALEYTLGFAPWPTGLRLFCIQPMMMALMTLERVLTHPDITPDDRPKITRDQVTEVLTTSHRLVADDAGLRAWYGRVRQALADQLVSAR